MLIRIYISVLWCTLFWCGGIFALPGPDKVNFQEDSLFVSSQKGYEQSLRTTLAFYENALNKKFADSVDLYKKMALANAELGHPIKSGKYAEKYIENTLDFDILYSASFDAVKNSPEYTSLKQKYLPKVDFLVFLYFYIALIGFYFAITLNFTRNSDKVSKMLIGGFIFVHSVFILEFCLYASNYHFRIPHHYLMSASVSLLYGPLLYLYFRRINQNRKLTKKDAWHFLPNILLLFFLIPAISLPGGEKIKILLNISAEYKPEHFFYLIFPPKILSLAVYGYFIRRVHLKGTREKLIHKDIIHWEKNLFTFHVVYLAAYFIYGISISGVLGTAPPVIFHIPVIAMALMVLYVVHMAFVQPKVFSYSAYTSETILNVFKYRNSGLTATLSDELRQSLLYLLNEEKIYKDNSLNLAKLSERLGTTRHNASQIINEHFNMNFFELINKFRIQEAMKILETDIHSNLNIIDVAYEVGYNNKVTFNKAFKKETSQTPSEYIESQKVSAF